MISKWTLLVLLIVAATCRATKSARIVGGQETTIEAHPSVVQIESQSGIFWSQSCAGSILTTRFVLSAAQCFSGFLFSPNRRRVRAGATNRGRGGVVIAVRRVMNHPTFRSASLEGDLSVVELSAAFIYNPSIQQASIVGQNFELPDYLLVTQVGWGSTKLNGRGSASVLQKVNTYIVNQKTCTETYASMPSPRAISDSMLCTGMVENAGFCNGDEGGPIIYDDIVIGVISWNHNCGNATHPSISTRISSFTNWIIINAS